jgi:hypothetical protein
MQGPQRSHVTENVPGILSPTHRGMQAILRHRQPDLRNVTGWVCRNLSHRYVELPRALRVLLPRSDRNLRFHDARRFLDFDYSLTRVVSDELAVTIHYEFRGISIFLEQSHISLLPLCPLGGRVGVDPAVVIPVIHMLFECDNLCPGYRLLLVQLLQQGIGRRTRGTALRGKQFNHHGLAAHLWSGCLRLRYCGEDRAGNNENER